MITCLFIDETPSQRFTGAGCERAHHRHNTNTRDTRQLPGVALNHLSHWSRQYSLVMVHADGEDGPGGGHSVAEGAVG